MGGNGVAFCSDEGGCEFAEEQCCAKGVRDGVAGEMHGAMEEDPIFFEALFVHDFWKRTVGVKMQKKVWGFRCSCNWRGNVRAREDQSVKTSEFAGKIAHMSLVEKE